MKKHRQKTGNCFWAKLHFYIFFRKKDSSNKHISWRNKKFDKNRPKKKGQSHFAKKSVKIGKKKGDVLDKTSFWSLFLHFFKKIDFFLTKNNSNKHQSTTPSFGDFKFFTISSFRQIIEIN
jgi:hypothetical protein